MTEGQLYDEWQRRLENANRANQDLTQFEVGVDKSTPGWEFGVMEAAGIALERAHAEINEWYHAERIRLFGSE